ARDEGRVLVPVALGERDDQPFADVPREVEVDVRDGVELPVQEGAERAPCLDGVDVREAGQVADERADRAPAPPAGWQRMPRRVAPPHLARDIRGQLEYFPVEQKKSCQPEVADQRKLLVESCTGFALPSVCAA